MSKHGTYRSSKTGKLERYDSTYELRRFIFLDFDPDVIDWTKEHGIRIRYKDGRRWRHYLPDILVTRTGGKKILEEVKGYVRDRGNLSRKNMAALSWCQLRGISYRIIFKEHLETP